MKTPERALMDGLFERNHLRIFRFLRRLCRSSEQAEDLTQDVFVRAAQSGHRLSPDMNEAAWLLTIARNLWIDSGRAVARRPVEVGLDQTGVNTSSPVQALRFDLEQALQGLGDSERKVILMKEVLGLSYREIGGLLGLTEDAVRSRIFRARRSLCRGLRPAASRTTLEATTLEAKS